MTLAIINVWRSSEYGFICGGDLLYLFIHGMTLVLTIRNRGHYHSTVSTFLVSGMKSTFPLKPNNKTN